VSQPLQQNGSALLQLDFDWLPNIFSNPKIHGIVPTYSKLTVPRFPSNTTHRTIKSAKKLWLILPSQLQRNEDWNKKNAAVLADYTTHGASGLCRGNFCASRAAKEHLQLKAGWILSFDPSVPAKSSLNQSVVWLTVWLTVSVCLECASCS